MDDCAEIVCSGSKNDVARSFVSDVRKIAEWYGVNFFVVTDGASGCGVCGVSPAVRHARRSHVEWERKNGIDSDHNWHV